MFVAYSKDRSAVECLAGLFLDAVRDPAVLREALETANPRLRG